MQKKSLILLVCLAFGVAFGHVVFRTIFPQELSHGHQAVRLPVLVSPNRQDRNLYLRHTFYLSQRPRSGWLHLLGRNELEVYLNGQLIGYQKSETVAAQMVADLTPHLQQGKNVVALVCHQHVLDIPPHVWVEGICDLGDSQYRIDVEKNWQHMDLCDRRGDYWFASDFDDSHWKPALQEQRRLVTNYHTFPAAIKDRARGSWIGVDDLSAKTVTLRRRFSTPERVHHGWLRLQSNVPSRLAINGHLVSTNESVLGTDLPTPRERQQIFDISKWLRGNQTEVRILLRAEKTTAQARVDLELIGSSGQTYRFASDRHWLWNCPGQEGWLAKDDSHTPWRPCQPLDVLQGSQPWEQIRTVAPVQPPRGLQWANTTAYLAFLAVCVLVTTLVILLLERRKDNEHDDQTRLPSGATVLPLLSTALLLGALILLTHDPRIPDAWVYRVETLYGIAALILIQGALLAWLGRESKSGRAASSQVDPLRLGWLSTLLLLLPIIATGAYLRIDQINLRPLSPDEVTMYRVTMSIWDHGFPKLDIHDDLPLVEASTSELVPYGHWLSSNFFQEDRLVVRTVPTLWGTATIVLIFWIGRQLFDPWVGLTAAALYAWSPYCASMANSARYYSQLQFFALLIVYFYYRTIEPPGAIHRKYMWATVGTFCLMFLSWEGSAILCLGLVLAGFYDRRKHLQTLFMEPHIWFGIMVLGILVLTQSAHRVLVQTARPLYGSGASDVALTPMWKFPGFDPWFYVWTGTWNHDTFLPAITLLLAFWITIGHPFRRPARVLLITFLTTALVQALGLPVTASRYAYHLTPLWILVGSAGVVALVRELTALGGHFRFGFAARYNRVICLLLLFCFVLLSCGLGLDLSEMSHWRVSGKSRSAIKFPGQNRTSLFVREHAHPDDVVIVNAPHVVDHYLGRPSDYWLQSQLHLQCLLSDNDAVPLHRYKGTPMLTDVSHLQDVFAKHARIWFVTEPGFNNRTNDQDTVQFLRENMDVVFEDFGSMVLFRDAHRNAKTRRRNEATLKQGLNFLN